MQGILSRLPGGGWVNDRLQLLAGGLRHFEDDIRRKVADWAALMEYLRSVGRPAINGAGILEIGSGWYPTLPVCFALGGAGRILTVDLHRHLSAGLTFRMLRALEGHLEQIALRAQRSVAHVRRAYRRLRAATELQGLLRACCIEYRAPQDGARLDFVGAGSFDLVYSNSVLEHVEPSVLPKLMSEAWRVLKPGALMVHAVACNDHYAHFDRHISFVNYLRFSERQWRKWNNRLNYQNRLRAPDFIRYATESGFTIIHEARAVRPGCREALACLPVAREFQHYSREDLVATSVDFVAQKRL